MGDNVVRARRRDRLCGALTAYCRQVENYPLLSAEREQELAQIIQSPFLGDEAAEAARQEAVRRAKDELTTSNLRLVIHIARTYPEKRQPLPDRIQDGNLGLMQAVDRYEPRGIRFSTYAGDWIKQAIKTGIVYRLPTISIPMNVINAVNKYRRFRNHPDTKHLTFDDFADHYKLRPGQRERVLHVLGLGYVRSFPMVTDDRDEVRVMEPADPRTINEVEVNDNLDKLSRELNRIRMTDQRSYAIIARRYGLGGGEGDGLREIGEQFGLTKERVRQIQREVERSLHDRFVA